MKKRFASFITVFFCVFMIGLTMPITTHADSAPKPSVVINFSGLDDVTYYVTLLSKTESTGPYSASTNNKTSIYKEGDEDYDISLKFLAYKDNDGYYFLQYFSKCSNNSSFLWGYYPPSDFKILIYFPDTDTFAVSSEAYNRYAFDSYYKVVVSDSNINTVEQDFTITAEKDYDFRAEILSLIARIVITILIEIAIALLFLYKTKKHLLVIGLTNIVTQTVLNVLLNIINYKQGELSFVIAYFWLELLVFAIEATVYFFVFRKFQNKKGLFNALPILYALLANAASFGIGLWIAQIIPGIF